MIRAVAWCVAVVGSVGIAAVALTESPVGPVVWLAGVVLVALVVLIATDPEKPR